VNRPEVSVVMPFAGDPAAAREAVHALQSLQTRPGDELILVDNGGVSPDVLLGAAREAGAEALEVVQAIAERSPAHARNVGAARARNGWILFIDADCNPRPDLLDAYFAEAVPDEVGALVGEVVAAPGAQTLVGRYGAARGFLSQQAHLDHPYRPRAAAANLLVRRAAFEAVGGFYEGVRAAEDTDFSWRLQQSGWRLELRAGAYVEHRYRSTLGDLRRQWRGYAAGRAWLARRYEGFEPEPGVTRALRRLRRRGRSTPAPRISSTAPRTSSTAPGAGRAERGAYVAIDALLSVEELAGFALSNRPAHRARGRSRAAEVVLVADRFPAQGDPLVELAQALEHVRVEALSRPDSLDLELARGLRVEYVEDDGAAVRLIATALLVVRHPLRCALDLLRRRSGQPPLRELAPAVRRLERDRRARIHALGAGASIGAAERLARLSGRRIDR
jgi:GT2 family glycosyltransferase